MPAARARLDAVQVIEQSGRRMVDGERDLQAILASLMVTRREGTFVYVSLASDSITDAAAAIAEDEGTTYVVQRALAERLGLR